MNNLLSEKEEASMATESFTNTVIIHEDGLKCFCEILEKGKDYTFERSNKIPMGDPKDLDLDKFFKHK